MSQHELIVIMCNETKEYQAIWLEIGLYILVWKKRKEAFVLDGDLTKVTNVIDFTQVQFVCFLCALKILVNGLKR